MKKNFCIISILMILGLLSSCQPDGDKVTASESPLNEQLLEKLANDYRAEDSKYANYEKTLTEYSTFYSDDAEKNAKIKLVVESVESLLKVRDQFLEKVMEEISQKDLDMPSAKTYIVQRMDELYDKTTAYYTAIATQTDPEKRRTGIDRVFTEVEVDYENILEKAHEEIYKNENSAWNRLMNDFPKNDLKI